MIVNTACPSGEPVPEEDAAPLLDLVDRHLDLPRDLVDRVTSNHAQYDLRLTLRTPSLGELFGLKQTVPYAMGRPHEPPTFKERLFYRWVRHPLMFGFLIAFWATPTMSQGRLLFAVVTTAYILIAIQIEERTLVQLHGDHYWDYQRRVSTVLPFGLRGRDDGNWAPTEQPAPSRPAETRSTTIANTSQRHPDRNSTAVH